MAYRGAHAADAAGPPPAVRVIPVRLTASLDRPRSIVVAGSAGGKVRSAARLVGEAAIRSGLWAVQRDDYPVTVQTGHSLAQLVLSPEELPLITVAAPDVLVLLTDDGLRKATSLLRAMQADGVVVTVPEFAEVETPAQVVVVDPASAPTRVGKAELALVMLAATISRLELLPLDALREAANAGAYAEANLVSIETGIGLAGIGR